MKTYSDLKSAVQKASTPEAACGIFVDGVSSIIETNKSDPASLHDFGNELRANRQSLVGTLTNGNK